MRGGKTILVFYSIQLNYMYFPSTQTREFNGVLFFRILLFLLISYQYKPAEFFQPWLCRINCYQVKQLYQDLRPTAKSLDDARPRNQF